MSGWKALRAVRRGSRGRVLGVLAGAPKDRAAEKASRGRSHDHAPAGAHDWRSCGKNSHSAGGLSMHHQRINDVDHTHSDAVCGHQAPPRRLT